MYNFAIKSIYLSVRILCIFFTFEEKTLLCVVVDRRLNEGRVADIQGLGVMIPRVWG
jgi:hypothetical protein